MDCPVRMDARCAAWQKARAMRVPEAGSQWYVRVRGDVRGPVDEATVRTWLAQGMIEAEVCPVGGAAYVPVGKSAFAWADPTTKRRQQVIGAIVLFVVFDILAVVLGVMRERSKEQVAAMKTTLPAVGTKGALRATEPVALCPTDKFAWGWSCSKSQRTTIAPGSHVQVMKAAVYANEALCRYWVQDGAQAGVAGDGPCAWLVVE